MPYLTAAVALLGAVTVLNLMLTLAVIRRLRRTEEAEDPRSGPAVGDRLPPLRATSTAGDAVDGSGLAGAPSVVAFLSTTCAACMPSIPHLIDYVTSHSIPADRVIAVVQADDGDPGEYGAALEGHATVLVEPESGPLSREYSIVFYPTFVFADAAGNVTRTSSGSGPLTTAV